MITKDRILFFDIWRITAILLIVAIHASVASNLQFPILHQISWLFGGVAGLMGYAGNIGGLGVSLFIILSGCVIEYTYGNRLLCESAFNYQDFIKKRLVRLYPAYWLSLVLAVVLNLAVLGIGVIELVKTASGFWMFQTLLSNVSNLQQPINPMGWFIGVILCLYLVYPTVSWVLLKTGFFGMIGFFAVSYETVWLLHAMAPVGMDFYWFPLAHLFEFALGVYMVQTGWYFKTVTTSNAVRFASDLCFPVFLVHYVLIPVLQVVPVDYYLNVVIYAGAVVGMSVVILKASKWIENMFYRSDVT